MTIQQAAGQDQATQADVAARYGQARKYIAEHGVFIKHFRPTLLVPGGKLVNQFGGMTVAYRKEGNFLQLATAVCSDADNYHAKLGTSLAVERLANNQFILLPLYEGDAHETVLDMFIDQFEGYLPEGAFGEHDESRDFEVPDALGFLLDINAASLHQAMSEAAEAGVDGVAKLKASFAETPAADLLASLRNSPHGQAAASFIDMLLNRRGH